MSMSMSISISMRDGRYDTMATARATTYSVGAVSDCDVVRFSCRGSQVIETVLFDIDGHYR
jgi:hypothetical protein